jgi:hypothetical protein
MLHLIKKYCGLRREKLSVVSERVRRIPSITAALVY